MSTNWKPQVITLKVLHSNEDQAVTDNDCLSVRNELKRAGFIDLGIQLYEQFGEWHTFYQVLEVIPHPHILRSLMDVELSIKYKVQNQQLKDQLLEWYSKQK